jgi:hypothetical protein
VLHHQPGDFGQLTLGQLSELLVDTMIERAGLESVAEGLGVEGSF